MNRMWTVPFIAVTILCLPVSVNSQPPAQVTLQNNTLPGFQSIHELIVTVRRTTPRGQSVETLTYEQRGKLVQCNVALPQPGKILCYQMLTVRPAKVLGLFHDKKQIKPTPKADRFSLPRGMATLTSESRTLRQSRLATPTDDAIRSALFEAMMDFAYWPPRKIDAGHAWERIVESPRFSGKQIFQFVNLEKLDGDITARLLMKVEGRLNGTLEREYNFNNADATIHWNRLHRTLHRLDASARYDRKRPGGLEEYDLRLDLRLSNHTQLSDEAQELVKEQMTVFLGAISAFNAGQMRDVLAACNDYRKAWPKSVWLPAVDELARHAAATTGEDRMSTAQLKEAITRSFVAFEAAHAERDYDSMERTIDLMRAFAADYAVTLGKLLRDKDEMVRANAAFALAFGQRPQDLRDTQKAAGDASVKVRIAALTGWTAAANRQVSAELLLKALDDQEAGVRRRALQAVATCVPREDLLVSKLVEKIDLLMVHDKVDGVRADAVETLAAIGAPADIPRLEQALKHEMNTSIRTKIDGAIETLRKRR